MLGDTLCAKKLDTGLWIGVVGGDVNVPIDVIFGDGLNNALCSLNVDVL